MKPPKPRTIYNQPELTRLPSHSLWQRMFRILVRIIVKIIVLVALRVKTYGLENFPASGPALIVLNHLGDADALLVAAYLPPTIDGIASIDLYFQYPWLGKIMDLYGVIWVHRGHPDRRALRTSIEDLKKGRLVAIAPEGRESLTGSLEEGTSGAAFLALHTGVQIVPVTFTGTSNRVTYPNLRCFRRSAVSMTVGSPFSLQETGVGREVLVAATGEIMQALARQLPEELRGFYKSQNNLS